MVIVATGVAGSGKTTHCDISLRPGVIVIAIRGRLHV